MGHADLQREAIQVDGRLPNTLQAPYGLEFQAREGLSGIDFIDRPERGFHHAAGCAENSGRSGRLSHRRIEIALRQALEIEVGALDQARQFAGGNRIIHIRIAVHRELFPLALEFLGQARHDGNHHQVLARDAHLLCPIGLGDGAEHLSRRLGRRRIVQQVRILVFKEIHPGRAAGSHDGELHALIPTQEGFQPLQDLRPFFHNGQVGREIRIENMVEAQEPEGGGHLSGDDAARCHAEFLSERHAHGRGRLGDHHLLRIAEIFQQPVRIVPLRQGAGRTNRHALTTVGTVGFLEHPVKSRGDGGIESPADSPEHPHRLHLVAHAFAAAAKDAFVHVAGNGGRLFFLARGLLALVGHPPDIEPGNQFLEFAVIALWTGQAVVRMIGQNQFGYGFAGAYDTGGIGSDHHTFRNHRRTGRSQVTASLHFHDTDAARSGSILHAGAFEVDMAQGRNPDADGCSRIQHRRPLGHANGPVVYRKMYHIFHGKQD